MRRTAVTLLCAALFGALLGHAPTAAADYLYRYRLNGAAAVQQTAPVACTPGKQAFAHTGATATFTVPAGCTTLTVKAWGAGGGFNGATFNGGSNVSSGGGGGSGYFGGGSGGSAGGLLSSSSGGGGGSSYCGGSGVSGCTLTAGSGQSAAATGDADWAAGTGGGGAMEGNGGNGRVVLAW